MKSKVLGLLAVGLVAFGCNVGVADTVTVSATFDPTTFAASNLNRVAIDPVTIGSGDTLDLTVAFTTGGLTVGAGSAIWFGLLTVGNADTLQTTSTLSFAGASANVQGYGPLSQESAFVHVGSYFSNNLIQSGPGDFSFVTASQLLTVDGSSLGIARRYTEAFFFYTTFVGPPPSVPEPGTLALLGLGLAGLGLSRRRRAN